jgi:LysR family transcriptional regulator, glycine cleavage system transcriptional activator
LRLLRPVLCGARARDLAFLRELVLDVASKAPAEIAYSSFPGAEMRRNLPPLNALRVFEAAARHVHFTRAAEELRITQAAVSRQISSLEEWLDVKLFERRHSELRLTSAGSYYLEYVRQAFDLIGNSTNKILTKSAQSKIVLRSFATFASLWLMPRLPRFHEKHPDIQVDVLISVASIEVQREQADLIVAHGSSEFQAGVSHKLFTDVIAPVCSPKILRDIGDVRKSSDLSKMTLLHSRYRADDWSDWIAKYEAGFSAAPGLVFGSSILTYQAAKDGLGVAMGQIHLLESELRAGTLVLPLPLKLETPSSYFIVHTKQAEHDERVILLRDWIISEARLARTDC